MALTLPAAWKEAFDSDVTPIWLAELEVGVRGYFTVHDYAAGSADTASIQHTPDGGSVSTYTVTEGTDFDSVTSNEQAAANMAAAFRAILPSGVLCYAQGVLLTFIAPDGDAWGTRSTSDASAWTGDPSPTTTGTVKMCSGDRAIFDATPVVASVGRISVDFDPVTRRLPRPERMRLVLSDNGPGSFWRLLVTTYPDLRGKQITLKLGWAEASAESDFVTVGRYTIRSFHVRSGTPVININLEDASMTLLEAEVLPEVIQRHHLEAIKHIFEAVGLSSVDYDATSLDPTTYSDIGHWCTSWNSSTPSPQEITPPTEPVKALDLVNDLLSVLDGTFLPNETHAYTFRRPPIPTSSVDFELGIDDYREFEHKPVGQITDEVNFDGFVKFGSTSSLVRLIDENARHRAALPGVGSTGRPKVMNLSTNWSGQPAQFGGSLGQNTLPAGAGAGTVISLLGAPHGGFAGTRAATAPVPGTPPPTWTQSANTDLASSRKGYFLIFYPALDRREIISVDQVTGVQISEINTGSWRVAGFRIAERGLFGTSAQTWPPPDSEIVEDEEDQSIYEDRTWVLDVTAAAQAAERKLKRLASGMHEVEFMTGLRRLDMQLGETVSFPEAIEFIDNGIDGYDAANIPIFELVRKEITPTGIAWKATLVNFSEATAYNAVPVAPTFTVRYPPLRNRFSLELDGTDDSVYRDDSAVLDGGVYVAVSGWFKSVGSLADARHLFFAEQQFEIEAGVPGTHTNRSEVRVSINNGAYTETTTDGPILDGVWHHIAVLYDGTGSALGIYINGRKRATSASGTYPSAITDRSGVADIRLGANQAAANGTQWPGRLDEWAVFVDSSTAYDSDDIARWFNSGEPLNLGVEPTAWWRFENHIRDARNRAHLSYTGSPFFHGDVPKGIWSLTYSGDFDGSDDYVDYGDVTDLDGASSATWSFWVRQSSLDAGRVLHRMGNTGGGFRISITSSGNVEAILRNTGTNASETTTGAPITASSWHHVAIVYASSAITIYVDGVAAASTSYSTLPAAIEAPTPSGTLRMNESGGSSTSLAANLSNLAFWAGTAASAAQVAEIYNSGVPNDLNELPTLGDPDWWVTADGVWAPRNHSATATPAGGVGFAQEVP